MSAPAGRPTPRHPITRARGQISILGGALLIAFFPANLAVSSAQLI